LILVGHVESPLSREGLDERRWDDIPHIEGLSADEVAEVLVKIDLRVREALAEWFPDLDLGNPVMQEPPSPA
jgi:hypothetical protein